MKKIGLIVVRFYAAVLLLAFAALAVPQEGLEAVVLASRSYGLSQIEQTMLEVALCPVSLASLVKRAWSSALGPEETRIAVISPSNPGSIFLNPDALGFAPTLNEPCGYRIEGDRLECVFEGGRYWLRFR
ncbi:MAG: hypothetical protein WCJ29_03570 [bacterium]